MGEYFPITVTGINKAEVDRRVAEHILNGFEVVKEGEESHTVTRYRRTNSIGRSKFAFNSREERGKYTVMMRRKNTKRVHV